MDTRAITLTHKRRTFKLPQIELHLGNYTATAQQEWFKADIWSRSKIDTVKTW